MQVFLARFAAFLLILHARSNNACELPAPSVDNVDRYYDTFSEKVMSCIHESKESAEKLLESSRKIQQNQSIFLQKLANFTENIQDYNFTEFLGKLRFTSQMDKMFVDALTHYKKKHYEEPIKRKDFLPVRQYFGMHDDAKELVLLDEQTLRMLKYTYDVCVWGQSQQQFFYNLLKIYQYQTAQTFVILDILHRLRKKEINPRLHNIKVAVYQEYDSLTAKFLSFMSKLPNEFYVCDSVSSKSDKSPQPLELRAFQKYLFSTDQLETDDDVDDCRYVNDMKVENKVTCKDRSGTFHNRSRYMFDDYHVNSNHRMCQATKTCRNLYCPNKGVLDAVYMCLNPHSENRYDVYKYMSDNSFPFPNACFLSNKFTWLSHQNISVTVEPFDGLQRIHSFGGFTYPLCDCICFDNDYYINVELVKADIQDNKVVVGSRFAMDANTLYIEVLQAKLLPNGSADATTTSWKGPSSITGKRVKIDWHKMRRMDLTTTEVSIGEVLTGLGFREHEQGAVLEVLSTPCDIAGGRLTKISFNNHHTIAEKELHLPSTVKPVLTSSIRPTSKDNVFVMFTTTHDKSGGQNTVPFVDAQEVIPPILKPLSGAGLFHKGEQENAGFIALKLIQYNTWQNLSHPSVGTCKCETPECFIYDAACKAEAMI